ncbi:calpain-7-like [Paramacrobiotus metropolitanus]|uniref:calpain-7-like n=1 Tax=Paramacrobiotus metropolitanus TaxID=2943436 RepID=UPI002445B570|nr:calpain-7-like [Paramacrobiotus metropolitanus]
MSNSSGPTSPNDDLPQEIIQLANHAVQFDKSGNLEVAIYYYTEAANSLAQAKKHNIPFPNLDERFKEYRRRAEKLKEIQIARKEKELLENVKEQSQKDLERAEFLLYAALDADELQDKKQAVELYSEAIELCLGARNRTSSQDLKKKLGSLAAKCLDRAEFLKKQKESSDGERMDLSRLPSVPTTPLSPTDSLPSPVSPTMGMSLPAGGQLPGMDINASVPANFAPLPKSSSSSTLTVSGSESYSKEEIEVLRKTSRINGRDYVPFMAVDERERFAFPDLFVDRDGKLALAPKQLSAFKGWARPSELCSAPRMYDSIDPFTIRQSIISDCSFVASLAISALYEKRFNKKLITSIIYPQNRQGDPIYNPSGKYMVKLHVNGVPRKIIIDDYLPSNKYMDILCSYSHNKNEMWVSLLEKAYMKVMGGYDFPGSNSNIDLHALTGWIPERVNIRLKEDSFRPDEFFLKISERHKKGDVLATVATGDMSAKESERTGLVPLHAYALLDVREVQGKQLFLLKNPWSHMRWKGNFSERDVRHWTPSMQSALSYDPQSAKQFDNGVFWIDYPSVLRFFDVFYLNWNPALFRYTYCIHQEWRAGLGPVKDVYDMSGSPQFRLEVTFPPGVTTAALWVLLTRHITDRDDFAKNKEYITLLVYKTEGKRIFYPYDPPPFIDGVRINSPHYLCKMLLQQSAGATQRYTLVVSQYEKTNTIFYTLRCFSTVAFKMSKIVHSYGYKEDIISGKWKGTTAGGCPNYPNTYKNNPIHQINLDNAKPDNQLLITLKGPKQYSVGFDIVTVVSHCPTAFANFTRKSTGAFRSGFCVLELEAIPGGVYNVIPSTFLPGQEGPYFLSVQASCPIKVSQLQ